MTTTRVVYYIDTPDGKEVTRSSDVFSDLIAKLVLSMVRTEKDEDGDEDARMTGLARFAKLYKLRYTGRGYIDEFFYATLDGRSVHIGITSEKPGAIKIFERVREMLGDNVYMIYSMISVDDDTKVVTAVNTDLDGWFFNERVAALVTVDPNLKNVDNELFETLVTEMCNVYYGKDFDDLAHVIFREQSILPTLPEQLTGTFDTVAKCLTAGLRGDDAELENSLVNVIYIEFLSSFPSLG